MQALRWCLVLTISLTGCHHVFHIATDSVVRTEAPMETRSKVISETPPVSDSGPVVEMPVSGGCTGKAGKIAVVDVDGLLLNMDMTGMYSLGENPVGLFREKLDAIAADPCVSPPWWCASTVLAAASRRPTSCGAICKHFGPIRGVRSSPV